MLFCFCFFFTFWSSVVYLHPRATRVWRLIDEALPVFGSTCGSAIAPLLSSSHALPHWCRSPFHTTLGFQNAGSTAKRGQTVSSTSRSPSNINFRRKIVRLTFAVWLCCVILCGSSRYNVFVCVPKWKERCRGGAPFCWLSVPLCSPTAAKLLTGTFQNRDGEHVQCIASHTLTVYTHMGGLHGFTWSAGPTPAAAANNPSSHFSPGSVSTVHPFTALLL